jgi:hypothetical protein
MILASTTITSAVSTVVGNTLMLRAAPSGPLFPTNLLLQATFAYGSGGTNTTAYVRTSLDGQTTWTDIANFSFTTSSGRLIANVNSSTSVTADYTATNGTLGGGTVKDGILGNFLRVLLATTGTNAGNTSIRIDAIANGLTAWTSGD